MQPSERENIPPNDDVLRIVPGVPFYPFETVTATTNGLILYRTRRFLGMR
jgi:hypothetical protein